MWAETFAATRKTETKLRKTGKTWKKITQMEVTSVKMRYQI